jgi:hypothetical protein
MRGRKKKPACRCWIYNGDDGPEVYLLDERGRLQNPENGGRGRYWVARPVSPSMVAKMQKPPNPPSSAASAIGDVAISPAQGEFNDTQSVDSPMVSNWFSESESYDLKDMESESKAPGFLFDLDADFKF